MIDLNTPQLHDPIWSVPGETPEHVNVVCVYWGNKYPAKYVDRLRNMVARNMQHTNYDFYCITEEQISEDIKTLKPSDNWGTWWQKINLFNPEVVPPGKTLYFDIDSVIVGNIDDLAAMKTDLPLTIIENFSMNKRHCAHNSSTILWDSGDPRVTRIYEEFKKDSKRVMEGLHGDQCWIWRVLKDDVANFPSNLISSYKYHCRGKQLPPETRAVIFHGKPDPDEVNDKWVAEHWK